LAKLVSVNVGLPQDVEWRGQRVHTGIWKRPVAGPRAVRRLNVDGDGQGDLAGHGGEQRAVFVYQQASYDFWARTLGRADFTLGQFGENFTVEGLPDDEVRIGDRYRIGGATFEVTQPRVTCYRVGIRMDDPLMPARLVAEGRPGFYFRVLEEGEVTAGDEIVLLARNSASVSVADVDALLYRPQPDPAKIRRALGVPALSPGWRTSLQAILDRPAGATGNPGLATLDLSPAAQTGFRAARIAALARVTDDVRSVTLEAADGSELGYARPGQFVVLKAERSPDAPPLIRSYSISGVPDSRHYELGVKCEPNGAMGRYLSVQAKAGDPVEISAPRGAFVLDDSERTAVFISAGIGITPVFAMLKAIVAQRPARPVWWLYGARSGAEHPFAGEVRALLGALSNARAHVRYSRPGENDKPGADFDSTGHVDAALVRQLGIGTDAEFYLCGPPAFMRDLPAGLAAAGVAAADIHSEVFGAGPAVTPGIAGAPRVAPHAPPGTAGTGPVVSFARSGLNVPWDARYASLLEFAEACDVPARWSCRVGVCHTCESGLISGDVRYEPQPLQPPGAGNVLICCAVPIGEAVVDL
jgi:ferredoxin-NADP reductase/MOSC domain-containing protein YiiM/ferredoxin